MSLLANNGNVNTEMQVWYLKNPASGTHNVSITFATSSWEGIAFAADFANAGGAGATSTVLGQGTSTSVSISSTNGNDIVDFLNVTKATSSYQANPVAGSGQNLLISTTTAGGWAEGASGYTAATGTSPMNEQYTLAASSSFWQQYEIEVTAATSSATTTNFTYDNNGNLLSNGNATDTWDYRNELTEVFNAGGSSTYGYDYTGQRVLVTNGTSTSYYPETTYSANGTTRTKNIFADGVLVATITDTTSTIGGASLVQQATSSASSGTSLDTNLSSAPRTGDMLILTYGGSPVSSTISSISGGGVTWIKAVGSHTNRDSEIWYGLNASSSGTNVTTTISTACTSNCLINISEWAGMATSSALDATSTRNGFLATIPSPTSTTSNANDVVLTTEREVGVSLASGPTGAFAALATASSSNGNSAYDIVTTTVTTSTSWTFATSTQFDTVIAAFKAIPATNTSTITTNYVFDDHLGGANLVVNVSGTILETLQYFPYGSIRIDNTTSSYAGNQRKYIGQLYDAATQLSYLNARYYNGTQGQFISQDPMFLGNQSQQTLFDPQSLNAYSYSEDNPIIKSDPTGKCFDPVSFAFCALAAYGIGQALHDAGEAYIMDQHPDVFSQGQRNEANSTAVFNGSLVVLGQGMDLGGMELAGRALDVLTTGMDVLDKTGNDPLLKNAKRIEGNDDTTSNQIQLNIGTANSNSTLDSYLSQPVMSVVYQPSTRSPNAMGVVYNQSSGQQSGGGGTAGSYQQLLTLYAQVIGLYQQLLTQTSNSSQPSNSKK